MHEAHSSSRYRPLTSRQHQWFSQLELACDADDWASHWLRRERARAVLATFQTAEGDHHAVEVTPHFLVGIRRIIFSRLVDLTREGHGREALELVAGWRAMSADLPGEADD